MSEASFQTPGRSEERRVSVKDGPSGAGVVFLILLFRASCESLEGLTQQRRVDKQKKNVH
ncbi:MAG: hypothetical protein KJO32_05805 [Deltaproteobacteria bacterium]|nr:hypothetical protein [Deltaproteobacteria bacterium]